MTGRISISLLVLAGLGLGPRAAAWADADEASVHAQVQLGWAWVKGLHAPGQTDSAPFLGVGARATYATSNWFAYEASLWLGELTRPVRYALDSKTGRERERNMGWARADLGITARLGVRYIPTLHAALGVQRRVWRGRELEINLRDCPSEEEDTEPQDCAYVLPMETTMELVGTLGAGLDYRLGDHWITGLLVTGQHTMGAEARFRAIAAMVHISYYFYPEGAGP